MFTDLNFSKLNLRQDHRILSQTEKHHLLQFAAQTNIFIKKISANDFYAITARASSGDIICLIDYQKNLKRYRLVE